MSLKRQEWHQLLVSLKSTVEGLLASQAVNVWNTYGGLERLSKNIQHILSHDLKVPEGHSYNDVDFWPFVRALRWVDAAKWRAMESCQSGVSMARVWLRQSLLNLNLSSQLYSLVSHSEHLHKHYKDDAFLCQKEYFQALVICLQALEQNSPALLAEINASLITQHIRKKARRPARHHLNRSASVPAGSVEPDEKMMRRARTEDRLVPPLMSPKTESVFSTSYEHASVCGSGGSPETAKEALLQALRKSGEVVDTDDDEYYSFRSSHPSHRHSYPILNLYSQDLYSQGYHPQDPYSLKHSQAEISPYIPEDSDSSTFDVGFESYAKRINLERTAIQNAYSIKKESCDSTAANESQVGKSHDSQPTNRKATSATSCIMSSASKQELQWTTSQEIKKAPEYVSVNRTIVEDQEDPLRSPTALSMADLCDQNLDNQSMSRDSGISSVNQSFGNSLISPVSGLSSSCLSISSTLNQSDKPPKKFTHQRSQSDIGVPQSPRHPTPQPISKSPDTLDLRSAQHNRLLPQSEGFFPHPAKGQSLLSFLSSQDFHTCAELDKENAHFSISEALIAAIEQMKWNQVIRPTPPDVLSDDGHESDEEIRELKQRIRIRRRERLKEKARGFPALSDGRTDTATDSASIHSSSPSDSSLSDSGSSSDEDIHDEEINDTDGNEKISNLNSLKESGLSLSMASLYSDADIQRSIMNMKKEAEMKKSNPFADFASSSLVSAESVAISLLKKFSENQLPKASDLEWLVSEQDAPQRLLPLPNSFPICPDDGENSDIAYGKRTRLRGNLEWAPPRPQIIFNIHPPPKRKVVLARQNYRCAGCGAKVEPGYMKRYNYCEYLGKFFCPRCHCRKVAYIPGRILKKWNFTKYYVSNFAADLLARISGDPLFSIQDINVGLYRKVRALELMKECREKLRHLQRYIDTCRLRSIKLADEFKKMPSHWLKDIHCYTLDELVAVRQGELLPAIKAIVDNSILHISQCQLCRMKGFICEFCNKEEDIIFPFEIQRVIRCPDCSACYHSTCHEREQGRCPKCVRIQARQNRLAAVKVNDSDDELEEEKR